MSGQAAAYRDPDPTGVDLGRLAAWMDSRRLGWGAIEDARALSGGTQNVLVRFRRDGREYVLRRPPANLRDNSNETMRREARLLAALAGGPVPHARLIAACPDERVLGAAFYLMEPVHGFNPTNGLPARHAESPAMRGRMGLAAVEAIAALGSLDYRAVGLEGFGRPENYLQRQVARWKAQLEGYAQLPGWPGPRGLPGVDQVAAWLERHCPAHFEPGVIHGDYHLSNVMYRFDGPELAAVVDWELATIGDPLIDLGWLLATWPPDDRPRDFGINVQPWSGFPTGAELIDHYRPRTQRDLSAIDWYAVLACYKLGLIVEGTYARACAGLAPPEIGDRLHTHAVSLFERALQWIR